MSIKIDDDAILRLRCIDDVVSLDESMRPLRSRLAAPCEILFAGHPKQFAIWLDVYACDNNGWDGSDRDLLVGVMTVWLQSQRSCGSFAFIDMTANTSIWLESTFDALPRIISNYLQGIAPAIDTDAARMARLTHDSWTAICDAQTNSVLGLLRDSCEQGGLAEWLDGTEDTRALKLLSIPLFGCASSSELAAKRLRFAAWWHGSWRVIGSQSCCSIHTVCVDEHARMTAVTCMTDGLTPWSIDAVWEVLANRTDPVFAVDRTAETLRPLDMPGHGGGIVSSLLRHQSMAGANFEVLPSNLQSVLVSALRDTQFSLRTDLLSAMDIECLAMAHDVGQYHYLLADGDSRLRRNRCQASLVAPLLLDELRDGYAPVTRHAIDEAKPLFRAIASDMGVAPWAAKRMPRIRLQQINDAMGFTGLNASRNLALLIEQCGKHAPPFDLSALWVLHAIQKIGLDLTVGAEATGILRRLLLDMAGREASRAGWGRVREVMGLSAKGGSSGGLHERAPGSARQFCDYLGFVLQALRVCNEAKMSRYVDDPRRVSERMTAALADLMSGLMLSDLRRLLDHWHAALARIDVVRLRALGLSTQNTIPLLFEPCRLSKSGYHIQQLREVDELQQEGTEMQHCVVSYTARVASGHSLIIRLRHPDGIKRATLEFTYLLEEGRKWEIVQAQARSNMVPDDETLSAADECQQYLIALSKQIEHERLDPYIAAAMDSVGRYSDSVVQAVVLDPRCDRRWVPCASSHGVPHRLRQIFGASAMPSVDDG
jgi:hypothetical protein